MITERQFTYIGKVKYDITGLYPDDPFTVYQFVPFTVWNTVKHGILCQPGSHDAATHYVGGVRMGYSCKDCQWICPIQRWE